MTFDDVVKYFGNKYRASKACGFSVSTPYSWQERGFIPMESQEKIERLTGGELKANYEHTRHK